MALHPRTDVSLARPGGLGAALPPAATGRIARVAVIVGQPRPRTPAGDPPPEAGRDVGQALVVCTSPDVCKTPIGSSTPPIPYQITGRLGDDANTSRNVFLTSLKAFKFDSQVTHVMGDEAGSATGIQSGTVGDIAEPRTASSVVRVNGQWLVRDGDSFWMNRRNTGGELIYKKDRGKRWPPEDRPEIDDSEVRALLAKAQADGVPIEVYHSEKEKTGRAKLQYAVDARGYAASIRGIDPALDPAPVQLAYLESTPGAGQAASDAADNLMRDILKRTSQQAARNAAAAAAQEGTGSLLARGAGAAAGTLLGAVFFYFAMTGSTSSRDELPFNDILPRDDFERALLQRAQTAYTDGADPKLLRPELLKEIDRHRARTAPATEPATEPEKKTDTPVPQNSGGGGKDGTRITGKKDECEPEPYDENKCGKDEAAHHIVPDFILRVGTRLDPGLRMPGSPSLDKGPSICLNKADHTRVHREMAQGMRNKLASNGTISLQDVMDVAIDALDKVKPDCKRQFEQPVRDAFKDVPPEMLGRGMMKTNAELRDALTRMWSGK